MPSLWDALTAWHCGFLPCDLYKIYKTSNELAAVLGRCNVIVKLFADDLKMYAVMKTAFHADMFQHALDRLATWADEWQLQISITKCFIMLRLP